jgi:TRAP-type C4-dicarboxylate transport system permease small subunit
LTRLDGLADILRRVSAVFMALCLVALVGIDFAQVVLRYGLGTGWPWAGDLSIVLLLSLAWIGAGHLWLVRGHIAVDLILGDSRLGRTLALAFDLLVLVGGAVLLPMTVRTMQAYSFIDLPALPLPGSVKYMPVAAGIAFLVLAAALVLAQRLRR